MPPAFPNTLTAYFATNRNRLRSGGYGNRFYNGDPKLFRVGTVEIKKKRGRWEAGDPITFPERSRPAPENSKAEREWLLLGSETGFDAMRDSGTSGDTSDILVYVHGAGNTFDSAAETLAAMTELYSSQASRICPFYFTYPANGSSDPVNYFADRDDASVSGHAMARSFGKLISFLANRRVEGCRQRIHLLAHSLGNFALRKAVETIFGNPSYRRLRIFNSVFLAGADDDQDTLAHESKMRPLSLLTDKIVVYFDANDKLLRISDAVQMDRLGQKGPTPFPGHQLNGCEISAVDVSTVDFDHIDDPQRHRHHLGSTAVIRDIRSVIYGHEPEGRIPIEEREGFYRL